MLSWHFPGELRYLQTLEAKIAYLRNESLIWDTMSPK
jgi:hypothetical protein